MRMMRIELVICIHAILFEYDVTFVCNRFNF